MLEGMFIIYDNVKLTWVYHAFKLNYKLNVNNLWNKLNDKK